jgi:glutamate dehydrogenase
MPWRICCSTAWFGFCAAGSRGARRIVAHYREGIAAVESRAAAALPQAPAAARAGRESELRRQGVPEALARRIAALPALVAAPDIVMVADRTGRPIAEVAETYFAAAAFFRLDRIVGAARGIVIADYFDRLALDRALDSIGEAERRLTAAMTANAAAGRAAVEAWWRPARPRSSASRWRSTDRQFRPDLVKLSVAASLLGIWPGPKRRASSVPEMARAREDHGDAVVVGGLDHLVVAHRAAGLDHRGCARLDRD